jgi:hypothetical protein
MKDLKKQIRELIDEIANERDRLRLLLAENEDIIDSCDSAIEDFEHGLDNLSQYL